jgi:hypothetical protein
LNTEQRSLAQRLSVIARSEATKQSSAREAPNKKHGICRSLRAFLLARLPARGWIASP